MKEEDIQDMKNFKLSEFAAPWITDMTDGEMAGIIRWMRALELTNPIFGYSVLDEAILEQEEMEPNFVERQAQQQCFEALTEGYHGSTKERKDKFNLVDNSRFGWVPHAALYDWLKSMWKEVLMDVMFWNLLLHTKSDKNNQHSYVLKYWPNMKMVLIKVARTPKR
eukprot:464610-Heterocapsa_arctica.AAC.1